MLLCPLMSEQNYERKMPSSRQSSRKTRDISPYSKNFKCYIKSDERDLLYKRQLVTKLPRKDLEDKYIELCDENFFLKRQNNENEEKIKILTARIVRLSECHRSVSSSAILKENNIKRKLTVKSDSEITKAQEEGTIPRASSLNTIFKKNGKAYRSSSSNATPVMRDEPAEKGIQELSEKCDTSEKELLSLKEKVESLQKAMEQQTELSDQLQKEKNILEHRLSEVDLKKFLIENIEINRLKRKLEHFREVAHKLRDHNHKIAHNKALQIQAIKVENYEVTKKLKEEITKNSVLSEQLEELNSCLRTVEGLKKQNSELEYDKKKLIEQQENLATLVKDTASYKQARVEIPFTIDVQELFEKIERLETEKAAIENSNNEMLNKIRILQDLNDKLLVDIEGYKAERDTQSGVDDISERVM